MCLSLVHVRRFTKFMLYATHRFEYCQLVQIKTTWTIEKCLFLHSLKVFPLSFRCQNIQTLEFNLGISFVCNGPDLNELSPKI